MFPPSGSNFNPSFRDIPTGSYVALPLQAGEKAPGYLFRSDGQMLTQREWDGFYTNGKTQLTLWGRIRYYDSDRFGDMHTKRFHDRLFGGSRHGYGGVGDWNDSEDYEH